MFNRIKLKRLLGFASVLLLLLLLKKIPRQKATKARVFDADERNWIWEDQFESSEGKITLCEEKLRKRNYYLRNLTPRNAIFSPVQIESSLVRRFHENKQPILEHELSPKQQTSEVLRVHALA
jgi:hypothetical protein